MHHLVRHCLAGVVLYNILPVRYEIAKAHSSNLLLLSGGLQNSFSMGCTDTKHRHRANITAVSVAGADLAKQSCLNVGSIQPDCTCHDMQLVAGTST